MRIALAALSALALASCASEPQRAAVQYHTVVVPAPVSCVPASLGEPRKFLRPRDLLGMSGPERYAAMAADWLDRVARMDATEPVVEECRRAAEAR